MSVEKRERRDELSTLRQRVDYWRKEAAYLRLQLDAMEGCKVDLPRIDRFAAYLVHEMDRMAAEPEQGTPAWKKWLDRSPAIDWRTLRTLILKLGKMAERGELQLPE